VLAEVVVGGAIVFGVGGRISVRAGAVLFTHEDLELGVDGVGLFLVLGDDVGGGLADEEAKQQGDDEDIVDGAEEAEVEDDVAREDEIDEGGNGQRLEPLGHGGVLHQRPDRLDPL
jgi:hypothetical protein